MSTQSGLEIEREHAAMTAYLGKPGTDIIDTLSPIKAELLHYGFALCLEAGELGDILKKFIIYNQPISDKTREHLVEELGDIEFYIERIRALFGISRTETLYHNINKLAKRYPQQSYTDSAAQLRADKAPETTDTFRE